MSKLFKTICIITLLFSSLYGKEIKGVAGYLTDGMDNIKYKDTHIALKMWMDDFTHESNAVVDLIFYNSSEEIIKDFVDTKLTYMLMNPIFYLENQIVIDALAEEFWIFQKTNKQFERYFIITRKDSQIQTLHDLKNKTIATKSDNYLGKMFLDTELLRVTHKESQGFIKAYVDTKEFSTAILNTYFGKVDACIVPEYALELVAEMNPSIKLDLKVLTQSEEIFISLISIFRKGTDPDLMKSYRSNIHDLRKSARGKNILNLFKMQGHSNISKEKLLATKKYYKEYLRLRKKYVK